MPRVKLRPIRPHRYGEYLEFLKEEGAHGERASGLPKQH